MWTLTKCIEKKLDASFPRMLRAVLNKSWEQYPTKQQLYDHLPPILQTIQVKRTRHAGHCKRSKEKLISDVLLWTPPHGHASVGRSVWKRCRERWMIGTERERERERERESRKSDPSVRLDDDDDELCANKWAVARLKIMWHTNYSLKNHVWYMYKQNLTSNNHQRFGWLVGWLFYSISTFVGYLMSNPF